MEQDQTDMSLTALANTGFNAYMTPYTPQNFGRPSSPLNPHAGSSSPITSPTPQNQPYPHAHLSLQHQLYPVPPVSAVGGPSRPRTRVGRNTSLPSPASSSSKNTRYARRPTALEGRRTSLPSGSEMGLGGPLDLFTEGTSPVQGQMWRDRLGRRMEERERRKRTREDDMGRRRDTLGSLSAEDQEAADKRAAEDDEEIFRRLMVLQRRKAEHAALVSHEQETGGSDPLEPEFWEEEMEQFDPEAGMVNYSTRQPPQQLNYLNTPQHSFASSSSKYITPRPARGFGRDMTMGSYRERMEEEEDWGEEAAAAEAAEREAEEIAMLEMVEREYAQFARGAGGAASHTGEIRVEGGRREDGGMEVDWDGFDQMDME